MIKHVVINNPQTASDFFNAFGFWINFLGASTTILAAFFTIALAIIALLTWRHFELKKKAEKEVERITKLGDDMSRLASSFSRFEKERKEVMAKANKLLESTSKDAKEIKRLASQVKEKDANLGKIEKQIKERAQTMQHSLNSLASTSKYTPGDVITEAKQDATESLLEKLLAKPTQKYDGKIILEALKQRSERSK